MLNVSGGGATMTAPAGAGLPQGAGGAGRRVRAVTFEELAARSDALALKLGTRATASALLLACVVVILLGAQSMLGTLEEMDRDIKSMNEQLAVANGGLDVLNTTMDSLPPTRAHLGGVVKAVEQTGREVKVSARNIDAMATTTGNLQTGLDGIASSTVKMRKSLEGAAGSTERLGTTVGKLNTGIDPLVKTQHAMYGATGTMVKRLDGMNASLLFVVRQLNYISYPPYRTGFMVKTSLPKEMLPPIPGLRAEVKPLQVYPLGIFGVYQGP